MSFFLSKECPGIRGVTRPREFDDLMIPMFIVGCTRGLRGCTRRVTPKYTRGCTKGIRGRGWKVYADIFY